MKRGVVSVGYFCELLWTIFTGKKFWAWWSSTPSVAQVKNRVAWHLLSEKMFAISRDRTISLLLSFKPGHSQATIIFVRKQAMTVSIILSWHVYCTVMMIYSLDMNMGTCYSYFFFLFLLYALIFFISLQAANSYLRDQWFHSLQWKVSNNLLI